MLPKKFSELINSNEQQDYDDDEDDIVDEDEDDDFVTAQSKMYYAWSNFFISYGNHLISTIKTIT